MVFVCVFSVSLSAFLYLSLHYYLQCTLICTGLRSLLLLLVVVVFVIAAAVIVILIDCVYAAHSQH